MALRRICSRGASLSLSPFGVGSLRSSTVPLLTTSFYRSCASNPGAVKHDSQDWKTLRVPTIEQARNLPSTMSEVSNEGLTILAEQGCHEACFERLIRDIMRVDNLEWIEARKKAKAIRIRNRKGVAAASSMNWIGLTGSFACLVVSGPMVFSKEVTLWFNEKYVTMDVPEPKDMETWLEIGAWSWNWMEPVLGTGSFFLLCMQVMRSQFVNMNIEPWTEMMRSRRADRLVLQYPQYCEEILRDFARTAELRPSRKEKIMEAE